LHKKPKSCDNEEVVRKFDELRPVGLKGTDNKSIGGVCNRKLRKPLAKFISATQRGFTYGRVALQNVSDLDFASRLYSIECPQLLPALCAFDFGTAFAALSQRWLMIMLEVFKLPSGFIDLCQGFFSFVAGVGCGTNGLVQMLFLICSGVVQGCSLSGLLICHRYQPVPCRILRVYRENAAWNNQSVRR